MKLQTLLSLALVASTAAYRTIHTKKDPSKRRKLEQVCTTNCLVARSPTEIDVTIDLYPKDEESEFEIAFTQAQYGAPEGGNTTVNGWCIDWDRLTDDGVYSYDAFAYCDVDLSDPDSLHADAVDKRQYLPNVAYLVNTFYYGQEIKDEYVDEQYPSCTGTIKWLELQSAIWGVVDDLNGTGTQYEEFRSECVARWVRNQALANGNDYEIDCTDENEILPLILVDDTADEVIKTQVIIAEMLVKDIPGYCTCEEKICANSKFEFGKTEDCLKCASRSADGTVVIDATACKGSEVSWMCCLGTDISPMTPGACKVDGSPFETGSGKENKLNEVTKITLKDVDASATYVTIQAHDGINEGSAATAKDICGGNGKGAGTCTGITDTVVSLVGCPPPADERSAPTSPTTKAPAPTAPEPVPTAPEPAPTAPEPVPTAPEPAPTVPAPAPTVPAPVPTAPAPSPTPKGSGSGDPHFKTWTGEKFDYHGECDLVLLDNPSFNEGQGLKIHIRTTRVKYFSYIQTIAVQIGDDVLEFANDAENFLINGEAPEANKKHHKTHLGGFIVRRDKRALSIRLHDEGRHSHNVAKIDLHTRKNGFPAVIVDGGDSDILKGSLGLLGDWETGSRVGRDGKTAIEDHTAFAEEWQVRDNEPMLFTDARAPQYPAKCIPPQAHLGSRLGTDSMRKEAEKACAHWKEDKDDCIFDVIATRDVLVAAEGHIVHLN